MKPFRVSESYIENMGSKRITIRGVDADVFKEARQVVRDNLGLTMGAFITAAIEDYIESLPFEEDDAAGLPQTFES